MNRRWLQIALGIALVGLLLWRARVWELGDTLRDFSPVTAAVVVLLNLPVIAVLAFRTHLVRRRLGHDASPLSLLPISALGNVAVVVTPGATGDIIRAPFLKGHHAVSYSDGIATIVYERAYSFSILCLSTVLVVAWNVAPTPLRIVIPFLWLPVLVLPLAAAGPLLSLGAWAGGASTTRFWVMRPLVRALNLGEGRWIRALATLMRDLRLSLLFAGFTLAIIALVVLQLWLIADSLSISLSAGEASVALGASVVLGIASFLPLGLGVFDWTLTAVLERAGAAVASATAVAILYRATITLPLGLLGVLAYAYLIAKLGRADSDESSSDAGPSDGV
jgi:uncharacterized membrane protein YbhN (UPF0104 family)